jgi:hypothetical protein
MNLKITDAGTWLNLEMLELFELPLKVGEL